MGCSGRGLPIESLKLGRNGWPIHSSNAQLWDVGHPRERYDLEPDTSLQLRRPWRSWQLEVVCWPHSLQLGSETFLEEGSRQHISVCRRSRGKIGCQCFPRLPGCSEPPGLPLSACSLQPLMSSRKNYKEAGSLASCGSFLLLSFFRHLSFLLLYFRHNIHLKLLSNTNSLLWALGISTGKQTGPCSQSLYSREENDIELSTKLIVWLLIWYKYIKEACAMLKVQCILTY